MANLVKKFFEFIDLFYVPISFRYKKEDSYSTCIGGIFSFILIIDKENYLYILDFISLDLIKKIDCNIFFNEKILILLYY